MSGCVNTHVGNYNCHSECIKRFEELNTRLMELRQKIYGAELTDKNGYYFLKGMIDALEERLKKLEEPKRQCTCDELEKALFQRNKEFFDIREEVRNIIKKIEDEGYKPKPHKCPVCEGFRIRYWHENFGEVRKAEHCKSCDGKGIVWG